MEMYLLLAGLGFLVYKAKAREAANPNSIPANAQNVTTPAQPNGSPVIVNVPQQQQNIQASVQPVISPSMDEGSEGEEFTLPSTPQSNVVAPPPNNIVAAGPHNAVSGHQDNICMGGMVI